MLSSFIVFACILVAAAVIIFAALMHVTRGHSLQTDRVSGPYWSIKNQSLSATVSIYRFVNKSGYQIEWSYSSELFFDLGPNESAEADIELSPGEHVTLALLSRHTINLKAVRRNRFAKKFDLVATSQ